MSSSAWSPELFGHYHDLPWMGAVLPTGVWMREVLAPCAQKDGSPGWVVLWHLVRRSCWCPFEGCDLKMARGSRHPLFRKAVEIFQSPRGQSQRGLVDDFLMYWRLDKGSVAVARELDALHTGGVRGELAFARRIGMCEAVTEVWGQVSGVGLPKWTWLIVLVWSWLPARPGS